MILFINPISENIHFFVIHIGEVVEVRHTSTTPKGKDYDAFPDHVNELINRHNIDTIWCVLGPGAFTRMRIVTLTLNTIALVKNIALKGCHFFEIIKDSNPILIANNREYIILEKNTPLLREKSALNPSLRYTGYADKNDFTDEKNFIEYSEDIEYIKSVFDHAPLQNRLSPIYLKEPHITWSKKNIFPSSKKMKKS